MFIYSLCKAKQLQPWNFYRFVKGIIQRWLVHEKSAMDENPIKVFLICQNVKVELTIDFTFIVENVLLQPELCMQS